MNLQWAIHDVDSEYQTLEAVATVTAGSVAVGTINFPNAAPGFYRFNEASVTAGSGKIVAKLLA